MMSIKIFNHQDIHALHGEFYEDLRSAGRNEKGRTSRIVDLFTKWQDRFLIYAKYCSELPDAQEFLDRKIKQETSFAQKLEVNKITDIFWFIYRDLSEIADISHKGRSPRFLSRHSVHHIEPNKL